MQVTRRAFLGLSRSDSRVQEHGLPSVASYDSLSPPSCVASADECCCDRCFRCTAVEETRQIDGDTVCFDCMDYGEILVHDEARGMDGLVELILREGQESARDHVVLHEDFEAIGEDVWKRAVELARIRT